MGERTCKKLKKIQLIEEPKSEELLRQELEEALGGWNCGSYRDGIFGNSCTGYSSGSCQSGVGDNYCGTYNN